MSPVLVRASLRHLLVHRAQSALALTGVALGIATILAVDLANESARRAFERTGTRVGGRATHHVVGGPSGVPDALYRELRVDAGVRGAAPVIERDVAVVDRAGRSLHLLGVDPFVEAEAADEEVILSGTAVARLLTVPRTALLTRDAATDLGVRPGDQITIRVGTQRQRVDVVDLIAGRPGLENALVTDIATAQELTATAGRVDRIDLVVPDDADGRAALAAVTTRVPAGVDVVTAARRSNALVEATRAFRVNLTAMSLLALFVGLFLVYNTMLFSVVQRRHAIATLRSLGVTRAEIFVLVLVEAAALGAVATVVGIPVGMMLASGLVRLVTRTMNDLYFVMSVREVVVPPWELAKVALVGLAGTVLATVAPAVEATSTLPREALARVGIEQRARRAVPWLTGAGAGLLVLGGGILSSAGRNLVGSYAGLFVTFLGMALLVPVFAIGVIRVAEAPLGALLGPLGRLAVRGLDRSLSRTGVAMSALAVAVGASIGVTLMIGSFRDTVAGWLSTSVAADVYVSPPSLVGNRPDAVLPAELVERVRRLPGVAAVGESRVVRVDVDGLPTTVVAITAPRASDGDLRLRAGRAEDVWRAGDAVLVSEPFAYRHRRDVGDRVRVRSDRGEVELSIAGIVRDYGSSEGVILMNRTTYVRLWDDRATSSIAVYAATGVDPTALMQALWSAAGGVDVLIRPAGQIRDQSLAIFERTFAVTGVLRLLVTTVAFVGVVAALMALELDRAREIATLRAQGFTPGEVWRLVTAQTGLLGLVAGLAAVPIGVGLALLLVFVINQRAFGWTLDFSLAAGPLVRAVALAVAAAILGGVVPAWRLVRMSVAGALREE